MAIRRSITLVLLSILLIGMVGCTQPLNDRITLGGSYLSPTFRSQNSAQEDSFPPQLFESTPSSRNGWSPTRYISPVDEVVHAPVYRIMVSPSKKAYPRIYGRFPTPRNALIYHAPPLKVWVTDSFNTIFEIGRSVIGTPFAIGSYALSGHLGEPGVSPIKSYKRTNTSNNWSSGFPTPSEQIEQPTDEELSDE